MRQRQRDLISFTSMLMIWAGGSIGPNGQAVRRAAGKAAVKTPNIDRLAASGMNFPRGYGCHVCSPARSSQQTGFHQGHTFADRNNPLNQRKAMRANDILMGDALSKAGYTTGYWGKWGYGGSKDHDDPTILNVQTLPTLHGYQHVLAELHHVRAHTFFQPTLWNAPAKEEVKGGVELIPNSMKPYQDNKSYPDSPAWQNDPKYPIPAYCDDMYAFETLDFVREQGAHYKKTGKPFFALFAAQIPHAPFDEICTLPKWDAAYADDPHFAKLPKQAQQWAAMVTRIDAHIGNIVNVLDELGIAENTLIIFQSDNGGPRGSTILAYDANGGLSGVKGNIQEGGIRVPLVMSWPAKIQPNQTSKRVVDVTDLLPTFCELAGVPHPLGVDGVSIAPLLTGNGSQRPREFLIHEAVNGVSIIRGNDKLVNRVQRHGGKKAGKKAGARLFDLALDPEEKNNIAADHPELVAKLETLLQGERAGAKEGFANTYHYWIGKDGASTSSAENWSDYVYSNEGKTYMKDNGAPRLSWTAHMLNKGTTPVASKVDKDMEVLALEIGGNALQTLQLDAGKTLTGRNEIRLSKNGHLSLNDATVNSLRWIEIFAGGKLSGKGTINAALYTQGIVEVALAGQLKINGEAYLGGELTVTGNIPATQAEKPITILTAQKINGTFSNQTLVIDGKHYSIQYTGSAVTLNFNK